jgi:hypothetical protein
VQPGCVGVITTHSHVAGVYLHYRSGLGEVQLSSDAVIATFIRYPRTARIIEQIPQAEHDEFDRPGTRPTPSGGVTRCG